MITGVRRLLYQKGIFAAQKPTIPVVVVGNINVGGAGKTPLVIGLGKLLSANGISYAVISRGYGGNYSGVKIVSSKDKAAVVGDEPLLIKLKCGCPVVVAKSRADAVKTVASSFPEVEIIISDDGLQHYALDADIEVCVVNEKVGLGNGWLLPAGGLREPPSRLKNVDFVIYNCDKVGKANKPYYYVLGNAGWWHINDCERQHPSDFSPPKSHNLALSGIAHPDLFFERVAALGIAANTQALPDHHALTAADLPADKTLLMTEKDWVKAKEIRHNDAWFLAVEAQFSQAFKRHILDRIKQITRG